MYVFAQIAHIVDAIHARSVLHLDLKPDNIVLTGANEFRIIDFGHPTAYMKPTKKLRGRRGNSTFMPPEMYRAETYYGTPVDVFALGVTLARMLLGVYPFQTAKEDDF